MNETTDTKEAKRVVNPPGSDLCAGTTPVVSVLVEADEEVQWQWSHYASGQSVVSGYQIIKKSDQTSGEDKFDIQEALKEWLWGTQKNKKTSAPRRRIGFSM